MPDPTIELIPIRNAIRSDGPTTLDVLVRITPPTPEIHFVRTPINLGLVLDRSGSMAGARKIAYAREAATFAVEQLLPTDRVSITIFDNHVETIATNAPVSDKVGLVRRIKEIFPRGATALHAGWREGCNQVANGRRSEGLNRVILLSDGLANEGVTDPNTIAADVRAFAAQGVSTTTMGLGDDYNEDLMQVMGEVGDGNYYYIESPVQLVDIFHTELTGLMANVGQKVSFGIEPQGESKVADVLNDLDRNPKGRLMLANMMVGIPIPVVIRLTIPACRRETEVCRFRLAWDEPHGKARRTFHTKIVLAPCPTTQWEALPVDPEVAEQVALLMAARSKKEAIAAYDEGDLLRTAEIMHDAQALIMEMPTTTMISRELECIAQLQDALRDRKEAKFRKLSAWQAFLRKRGHHS